MNSVWRNLLAIAVAFSGGMAAFHAFGPAPAAIALAKPAPVKWGIARGAGPDLDGADGIWDERAPWGAPPKPVEPPPPPPPPAPVPVGIVKVARGYEAIFMVPGSGVEFRLRPGDRLPEGGRLLRIQGLRVLWIDRDNKKQQREMFIDPLQPPASSAVQ